MWQVQELLGVPVEGTGTGRIVTLCVQSGVAFLLGLGLYALSAAHHRNRAIAHFFVFKCSIVPLSILI